jgi:hypothetical protein
VRIGSKTKEEKKKGKINEGDVEWVRLLVGEEEKGGEKNKGEKQKKRRK